MPRHAPDRPGESAPRPLSARSVVLSLLLGADPAGLAARDLTRAVERFDVGGSTLRAALSRMVAAGDLRRTDTGYRLSDRLLERRGRQDEAVRPSTRAWHGDWEMVVITATGRCPAERAGLRTRLTALRLAELREGVWLRPANLRRPLPDDLGGVAEYCTARPARPARETAAALWPLDAWAATARALLGHAARAEGRPGDGRGVPAPAGHRAADGARPAVRLAVYAAVVRHLLTDPVLPPALLPDDWPGPALRAAYADYRGELTRAVTADGGDGPM